MPQTPDRGPGVLKIDEDGIDFEVDGSMPVANGQVRYVTGVGFRFMDNGVIRDLLGGASANHMGLAEVDFGEFPGALDALVRIEDQTEILNTSVVEAWIYPKATTDHSADEHMVEQIEIFAGNVVAGTGFEIYAFHNNTVLQGRYDSGLELRRGAPGTSRDRLGSGPGVTGRLLTDVSSDIHNKGTTIYGKWTVAWRWV